jgi:putative MATE family efflux protein
MWHYHLKHHHKKKDEEVRHEILTLSIWKLFAKLAVPGIFGMLMYAVYVFVDAIFVGQWVGKEGLAAISIVYPLTLINAGIYAFMGMGSASLLSRSIGAEDKETISRILSGNTLFVFLFSAVVTVCGFLFAEPLVYFMGGRGQILSYGTSYFRIVVLGFFFINFIGSSNMLIQAEGRIKAAMILISIGSILNVCLDPVFIKVLGLGVQGAAIATVIAMIVTAVLTLMYFIVGSSELSFSAKGFRYAPRLLRNIFAVGVSGMAMQLMTVTQQAMIIKSVGHYGGGDDLALIGATLNMLAFALIPLWGISQGLQPVIGMNYGANSYARVKEAFRKFLLAASLIALAIWVVFMTLPRTILGLYITDPALVSSAANLFRLFMVVFFLQGFIFLPATLFQAIGKGTVASLLLLAREVLVFAPIVIILPLFIGMNGVWVSLPIADALIVIIAVVLFSRELRTMGSPQRR